MSRRTIPLALMLLLFVAQTAHASWYDDYDAGLTAARKGQWALVVQKMTAAIKGNPKEGNKVKTYGVIFINYHPYYYRGIANLNLGNYEQAISDLETTSGPGPENLGDIGTQLEKAKRQFAAANEAPEPVRPTPVPTQTVEPVRPTPVQPAAPTMDPGLRQRAASAIASTKQKLQAAQARRATGSPQYTQALNIFTDASTRNASARSNDDLNTVIQMADNAGDLADLATAPNVPAPTPSPANPTIPSTTPITPKPIAAANAALEDHSEELKRALELYFAGEFEDAARDFENLTRKMPTNGWVWAFLGASQYSRYAFEADEAYRTAATKSFQKAKQLRNWKGGLPEKYFSKRIRQAFQNTAG